ncbi:MAG: hypothetical protein V1670_01780 [Candidatus Omnitrophota bacterium]
MAINPSFEAWAQETAADEIIARPVVEYQSVKLRDPFKGYLVKEEANQSLPEKADLVVPKFDLNKLNVQGIIWGVEAPLAIINNKVLTIGDLIEGAKILSIEKKGITFSFSGARFVLTVSGQNPVSAKKSK